MRDAGYRTVRGRLVLRPPRRRKQAKMGSGPYDSGQRSSPPPRLPLDTRGLKRHHHLLRRRVSHVIHGEDVWGTFSGRAGVILLGVRPAGLGTPTHSCNSYPAVVFYLFNFCEI
jgi:hypothetical protein